MGCIIFRFNVANYCLDRNTRQVKNIRDFSNFHGGTVADWISCEIPDRTPDYVSFAGSAYWDCGHSVKRLSDHWGWLISSKWLLDGKCKKMFACGECYYEDFRSVRCLLDDETQWPEEFQ